MSRLTSDKNRKKEDRIKELQAFIARFGSNASKARQATSRKKMMDKIVLDEILPSSRRYPFIGFTPDREAGKDILIVEGLGKTLNGEKILHNVSFTVNRGDRIVFLSRSDAARTALFRILSGEIEPDEGSFRWGQTTTQAYLPRENNAFFDGIDITLVDWLRQYSTDQTETFVRGFLGRMLFSGDEAMKRASVLSGGEKMRCMFSRLMLSTANVLMLDEPTNHLDLESIQAVNNGLGAFKGTLLFSSQDHKFIETIANRVIELTPTGIYDDAVPFDEFLENEAVQTRISAMYGPARR
jgi:ATPase subunit of ABC transporter with duplicated ATPase domains